MSISRSLIFQTSGWLRRWGVARRRARSDCAAHSHVIDPGRSLLWSSRRYSTGVWFVIAAQSLSRSRRKLYRPIHPKA